MSELSPDMFCTLDAQGNFTYASHASANLLGYSPKELVGRHYSSILHPRDLEITRETIEKIKKGARLNNFENTLIHQQGHLVPILWSAVWSETDQVIFGVARDITEKTRTFETIQRQTQKLNSIFESITDAFLTVDHNWALTYLNGEAERLLHLNRKIHLGHRLFDIFPEEENQEFYSHYREAFRTGQSVSFTAFLKKQNIWLRVKAFPSPEGLSVYLEDVTQALQDQRQLEMLSLVASGTDNGVIITDAQGLTEWVNEGFTKITGFTLADMKGKKPGQVLQGEKTDLDTVRMMREKISQGVFFNAVLINYRKSGEPFWFSMDITPIFDEQGAIRQFIAIQKDITYRKEAEANLVKMAKDLYNQNSDLQQFTYIVSHNLRAPVANALGLTDLLTKVDKNSELFENALVGLKQSVVQLDGVLKDMNLILSIRDSKGNLETEMVDLNQIIQQVLLPLQESLQSCGGKVVIDSTMPCQVKASKAYLYSIFYNLLSNAIKYRSEQRPLVVRIKCVVSNQQGTLVSVSDNGSGFNMQAAKDKIFKLYKRFHTNRKGRGIGLYLVKEHLQAMGGHVEVASEPGAGTRFVIFLKNS